MFMRKAVKRLVGIGDDNGGSVAATVVIRWRALLEKACFQWQKQVNMDTQASRGYACLGHQAARIPVRPPAGGARRTGPLPARQRCAELLCQHGNGCPTKALPRLG